MAEETNTTQSAADIVSAVTAQRQLAEASGKVAENIAQSFEQISEIFQKTNKAVSELGGTFSKLFGDINSVNDIPLVGAIGDMAMAIDKRIGLVVKTLTVVAEAFNKIDAAFVGLRRTSVITGASFGQSSMEVKRYADNQMATLGRLSSTLAVKTEEFDRYQEALRGMAFSYRDLDQSIQAWGPRRGVVDHLFAISKGLGMEFSTVLKDFEDLTLRAGHASGDFTKNAEATTRIYRGFAYSSRRLGVTIPFIRDEIMKAVTGHWTSITNIENRATDLRINYEKFYTQLAKQGQEGLAGDFLAKVQSGLTNLNLGQAVWLTGTTGVMSIGESLTLMAQIRDAKGGGRIQPMLAIIKESLERYSGITMESINQMMERGADIRHLAMQHTFQRKYIESFLNIGEGEAENLMGLINKLFAEGTSAEEREKISETVKNIFAQGKGVAQQQLTALQGIAINVKGLFLHYVYGHGAEKILEKQLGETPEEFERRHLADQEKKLKRPLTPEEKQSTIARARELWVNLREMVAVGAVQPNQVSEALKTLTGGTADFAGNVGGTRRGSRAPVLSPKFGRITSGYGLRADPFTGKTRFHTGVDIAAAEGTLLRTPVAGIATYYENHGGLGNAVIIKTDDGLERVFGHLLDASEQFKFKDTPVRVGDVIGVSGSTGRSTGPHVHYGARVSKGGKYVSSEPDKQEVRYLQHNIISKSKPHIISESKPPSPSMAPSPHGLPQAVQDVGVSLAAQPSIQSPPPSPQPESANAASDTGDNKSIFGGNGTVFRPVDVQVSLVEQPWKRKSNNDVTTGYAAR